jgi:PAS domain S-box-containing protein
MFPDPSLITAVQTVKGFFFIIISAVLIYFLIHREVKKLLSVQKELLDSSDRLSIALTGARVGSWDLSINRNSLLISDYLPETLRNGDKFINMPASDLMALVHSDDKYSLLRKLKLVSLNRLPVLSVECRLKLGPGKYIWIDIHGEVIAWNSSIPARLYGVFRDISVRKELFDNLQRRNRYIESIVENLPIGLAVNFIDSGKVEYMNKKFYEIYGWPKEMLQDVEKFFELVYPDEDYRKLIKETVMNDIASRDPERMHWEGVKTTSQDGTRKIINAKNIPIFDQNLMASLVEDVTVKTELENKLRQSQKMEAIGTLAGGIAHDFNNILTAIMGFAEILQRKIKDNHGDDYEVNEIVIASKRAADLVAQILTFSRMKEREKLPINLNSLIKEAIKLIRASIPAIIEIQINLTVDNAVIMGDPTQIHQVLLNLCTNAAYAMKQKGGVLKIGLSENLNGVYELTVEDSGGGIPVEYIDRIFEPYFTTKAAGEGTGMGLSMVHGIVKNHQGEITVKSMKDIGTVFTVSFPVYQKNPEISSLEKKTDFQKGSETILLLDDEAAISRFISLFLSQIGYRVHSMNDPHTAIEKINAGGEDYQLIITDQNMPGMTGLEFAEKVYSTSKNIPIILMSGQEVNEIARNVKTPNIKMFLQKPLNITTLSSAVRDCINNSE